MKKVKEFVNQEESKIKTHIVINGVDYGIDKNFTGKELIEKYGDCECETINYEKEYGEDEEGRPMISIRSFLAVYTYQG